jgi:hypothetical protein
MTISWSLAAILVVTIVGIASAKPSQQNTQGQTAQQYRAPDRRAAVAVLRAKKRSETDTLENRVEFYGADDRLLCALDYSSEDGEHGFGVAKGAWTADSQYLVFSLTSSGGHQPWHAPTQFYSRAPGIVRTLDDYLGGAGISSSDFKLTAPNIVKTAIFLLEKEEAVSVRLDTLSMTPKRRSKPFSIACAGGRVLRPEGP